MKKGILLALIISLVQSCSDPATISNEPVSKGLTLQHLNWLIGTWKFAKGQEVSYETWKKQNDTLLVGNSLVLLKNDTVFSEKLQLVQHGSNLFYIPSVRDQNNGQPVSFKFVEFKKGEFNFVNKEHDFPQRIIYKNPQPDFYAHELKGLKTENLRK
ncbi:MAG: DUF6265 family protein [Bacteroidia bacterium]